MTVREIIKDHNLASRLHFRQAGADQYWGTCPWCGRAAAFMLDPHKNEAWCTNRKCHGYLRKMTADELDRRIRGAKGR